MTREEGWEHEDAVLYSLTCTDRGRHKVTELAQFDEELSLLAEVNRKQPTTGKIRTARRDTAVRQWGPRPAWRPVGPLVTTGGVPVHPPAPIPGTRRAGYEVRCPRCRRTVRYSADRLRALVHKMASTGCTELDLSALG